MDSTIQNLNDRVDYSFAVAKRKSTLIVIDPSSSSPTLICHHYYLDLSLKIVCFTSWCPNTDTPVAIIPFVIASNVIP